MCLSNHSKLDTGGKTDCDLFTKSRRLLLFSCMDGEEATKTTA
jgi:hypothetical protein